MASGSGTEGCWNEEYWDMGQQGLEENEFMLIQVIERREERGTVGK